ncbi:MAG: hypothetical protein KAI74_07910, partial [Kiritimatiellae bacterium]|nr:hypothetical protein [Kiritimatiellia bacterium]
DGDGIPDAWEYKMYGKISTLDATGNYDHDGATDLQEYIADTDPDDNTDFLAITLEVTGETNSVSWSTHPTRHYRLQSNDDLLDGEWTNDVSGLLIPAMGTLTVHDKSATNVPSMFYRVKAIRPLSE